MVRPKKRGARCAFCGSGPHHSRDRRAGISVCGLVRRIFEGESTILLKKHQRSPYACGRFCIARANDYVQGQGRTLRDIVYVFEDGGPDVGGLVDLVKRSDLKLPSFESSRDTANQFATVQLQAADYLAYELRKAVVDHRDPFTKPEMFRKSFQAFFGCEADQGNYDEQGLLDLCEGAKIPTRIV